MNGFKKLICLLLVLMALAGCVLAVYPFSLADVAGGGAGDIWHIEVKREDGEIAVLNAEDTAALVEKLERTEVYFRGWAEHTMEGGWAYLSRVDAASGERCSTALLYLDDSGLLWVDDKAYGLRGAQGEAFAAALAAAIALS